MNAELRVGVAVGSLVVIGTALVADCDLPDTSGAVDNGSGKWESDDDGDKTDDWSDETDEVVADDEESWQHKPVSSGCTAGRIGRSCKDDGRLVAKGGGTMAEVAE